jgi:hypothetical protein
MHACCRGRGAANKQRTCREQSRISWIARPLYQLLEKNFEWRQLKFESVTGGLYTVVRVGESHLQASLK